MYYCTVCDAECHLLCEECVDWCDRITRYPALYALIHPLVCVPLCVQLWPLKTTWISSDLPSIKQLI